LARRRALDRLRRRLAYHRATDRFETQMRAEYNDKMRGPGVKPTNFDLSEILSRMIRLLPEPQQEAVQLTFFKGMSQLLVFRPFRESHFAHQPWLNPLNFLWGFCVFSTGDLSGKRFLVIRLPPTNQRTVRSEDDPVHVRTRRIPT
jgi:hypothetical protein